MAQHNDFGKMAEEMAASYLEKHGYEILETNWRFKKAEIDIIARKDNTLAVVEVKARTSDRYGNPEAFVSKKKIRLLTEAADAYVRQHDLDVEVRFDIISILKNRYTEELEHIENAFYWF